MVVFAGGRGTRMDHAEGLPKQLIMVQGKPILGYTLEHFQRHEGIDAIYLVSTDEHLDDVADLVRAHGIDKVRTIVPGGDSAHASIWAGLRAARADGVHDDAVVLIHDGVRPVIDTHMISANIVAARRHGSAITSIAAFETVAEAGDEPMVVGRIPDRPAMRVLQAPQTFRFGTVFAANERAAGENRIGSFVDQAQLMRHYGHELRMIDGLRGNVKITVPLDVVFFTHLVESGEYDRMISS